MVLFSHMGSGYAGFTQGSTVPWSYICGFSFEICGFSERGKCILIILQDTGKVRTF